MSTIVTPYYNALSRLGIDIGKVRSNVSIDDFFETLKNEQPKIKKLYIDAEWYREYQEAFGLKGYVDQILIQQCTVVSSGKKLNLILWDEEYPIPTELPDDMEGVVMVIPCAVREVRIIDVLSVMGYGFPESLDVYLFYTTMDLTACILGRERTIKALSEGMISKKRNVSGTIALDSLPCKIEIKDLLGAFNSTFEKALKSVGMSVRNKNLLTKHDKEDMRIPMKTRPNDTLKYVAHDASDLEEVWKLRVNQINQMVSDALGFNPAYTMDTCPRSSGALVSDVYNQWLGKNYPVLMTTSNAIANVVKNEYGIYKSYKDALREWDFSLPLEFEVSRKEKTPVKTTRKTKSSKKPRKVVINPANPRHPFYQSVEGLAIGGIRGMGMLNTTASLNAIVMGGRCNNEYPIEYSAENVLDIDLKSCYGTALADFYFPVGIPTVYGYLQDEQPITVEEFFKQNGNDLVPSLWQIVVEGTLDFEQDLVYSKLNVTPESIRRDLTKINTGSVEDDTHHLGWTAEVDRAHISGDFRLLRKELVNGIITSDVWEAITKISSSNEMKGWKQLKVVAAAWYPASKEVTPEQLQEILCRNAGYKFAAKGTGEVEDKRTRNWCRIPLKDFVGAFVSQRGKYKKQRKFKGDEYDVRQEGIKLFINTTYGDLAAPYFAMGNTVLANNITARARLGAWMMNKALATVESITDGGAYPCDRVRFLEPERYKGVRPSFHVLSDYKRLSAHRSIVVKPLFDFDYVYNELKRNVVWEDGERTLGGDSGTIKDFVDSKAEQHINEFWGKYGLKLPFGIEHKYENTAKSMVYWGSSDYLFINPVMGVSVKNCVSVDVEEYTIKVRGAKQDNHVKKRFLHYLAGTEELPDSDYVYEELIGVNQWLESRKSKKNEWTDIFLPGDSLIKTTVHRPNTNHMPNFTVEQLKAREKRNYMRVQRHKKDREKGLNTEYGIRTVLRRKVDRHQLTNILEKEFEKP